MLSHFSGPGLRTRAAGLISAGALVAGLAAGVPAATAAPEDAAASSSDAAAAPSARFTDGRYVVLLREPGAASYRGGDDRFGATRSASGDFDAQSSRVQAYTAHLRQTHRTIARQHDTTPVESFTVATNGFVADLSKEQALDLATDRRVLLVEKSQNYQLDTWDTPSFLGLSGKKGAWRQHGGAANAGAGVVVGVLDSGIWPESASFSGKPLSQTPQTRWDITRTGTKTRMEKADGTLFRGECVIADGWDEDDCNTKLIGARYYGDSFLASTPAEELADTEFVSARDGGGHGTHTASTAAGNKVDGVITEDREFGTVTGMARAARIAAYKVCWEAADPDASGCNNADIIAAIDQAVIDGVDIINFSVGGGSSPVLDAAEYAFAGAAEAGIFVAASAGNSGPDPTTLDHPGPWLTTVAASTHVNYENTVVLGNGEEYAGASITSQTMPSTPLVDAATSGLAEADPEVASLCGPDSLDPAVVEGTIVVCVRGVYDRVAKSAEVARAGGVAMVLINASPGSLDADFHSVPTIHLDDVAGAKVLEYLAEAGDDATASFELGNLTDVITELPQVAGFSSRGPIQLAGGDLLKPDIAAPGVSVLAAVAPPSNSERDYDLYSGTSMAAPHIAGLAAFIQGEHPRWSPMQIKSAMMTTAKPTRTVEGKGSADALAQGAGQVRPKRFFDPGLFVLSSSVEWRGFVSSLGYPTGVPAMDAKQINVPSLADGSVTAETSFTRTFRARYAGTWKIRSTVPGFTLTTDKLAVRATHRNDLEDITFTFTRTDAPLGSYAQGAVILEGPTKVRLPVALMPLSVDAPASVTGTGTAGSVDVALTAGFTGDLDVTTHGMAVSDTVEDAVPAKDYVLQCVTVEPDSSLARFQLDSVDDTADLDLFVYASDSCDDADIYAFAGQSATASGDESVTLRNPEAGTYLVEISGFSVGDSGADPIPYRFDFWDINPAASAGDLTVDPDPVPVIANQQSSVTVSWSGLEPGAHYLGYLGYPDTTNVTLVDVTTDAEAPAPPE